MPSDDAITPADLGADRSPGGFDTGSAILFLRYTGS
jgi:hypothetical protein